MTAAVVRTHTAASAADADITLDLFDDGLARATVHIADTFYRVDGVPIPERYEAFLAYAASVYVLDKSVPRELAPDRWTRQFELSIPIPANHSPDLKVLGRTLAFLTGDHWTVARAPDSYERWSESLPDFTGYEAVCLFSGGLDSFCGAVQLLEDGQKVVLVGHHDGGITSDRQRELAAGLEQLFPDQSVLHQINAGTHADETRAVDSVENSHRSRSLLFLAVGLAVAGTIGDQVPLYVPENGPISLNIPLTAARRGTASTRTTHPHYLRLIFEVIAGMGISNPIVNPFQMRTKGELVGEHISNSALTKLALATISCSKPDDSRYSSAPQRASWTFEDPNADNCGYCYPCLIRRASLATIGQDNVLDYRVDIATAPQVSDIDADPSRDTRALIAALRRDESRDEVLMSGPLPDRVDDHADVFLRGRQELRDWIATILPDALQ